MASSTIILVTRAGVAGAELTHRLEAGGWHALHCPSVRLVGPAAPERCARRLAALLPADRVIMTSPEGVRRAVELVGAAAFAEVPVIVPGPGTARVAREQGLARVISPAHSGDSEAMLALPELGSIAGLRILILAASGGRRLLEAVLRDGGADVHRVHVYRRLTVDFPGALVPKLLAADRVVSLISSGGALEALKASAPEPIWTRIMAGPVIVPSPRVAELAKKWMGSNRIHTAQGADDDAMVEALRSATSSAQLG
jgi:uroporphyrinogen-III synthase